mgnify:CR=1 FL=1
MAGDMVAVVLADLAEGCLEVEGRAEGGSQPKAGRPRAEIKCTTSIY